MSVIQPAACQEMTMFKHNTLQPNVFETPITTRKKLINDTFNASWKSYNDAFLKCHDVDCIVCVYIQCHSFEASLSTQFQWSTMTLL